jgi:pimeloyl-ACP methyl ester carboxylesterase
VRRVLFLGGNGHSEARLDGARRAIAARAAPIELVDAAYPGFDGRPRAASFDAFLDAVSARIAALPGGSLVYATGIGGLLALSLRARGAHLDVPFILQAPVLWGLERRLMPRVMRLLPADRVLSFVFSSPRYQAHFVKKQFVSPPPPEVVAAFFAGYARCAAAGDFFAWLTPRLLRDLERAFAARPEALGNLTVWWGARDRVVGVDELRLTEAKLEFSFPLVLFEDWGHYPMIEAPEAWITALVNHALEPAP